MNFFHKIFFIISFIIFLPVLAFAEKSDYLLVFAEFSDGAFGSVGVEQYAIDSSDVHLYEFGTYEVRLTHAEVVVGHNFFEVSGNKKKEVIGGNKDYRTYSTYTATKQSVRVALPLLVSVDPENSNIQILKGDVVLFDKKLSELDIDIISANTNRIMIKDREVSALPPLDSSQNTSTPSEHGSFLWLIILLILGIGAFVLHKKGKLKPLG